MTNLIFPFLFSLITFHFFPEIRSDSFPTSSEKIYVCFIDEGNIGVVDPGAGTIVRRIQVGAGPEFILIDRDRKKVYVSNTKSTKISVIDVQKESVVKTIDVPITTPDVLISVLAYNPVKNQLYVAEASQEKAGLNIWVIDAATDEIVTHFEAGASIGSLSVSADGKKLFAVINGEAINVYDTHTYSALTSIQSMVRRTVEPPSPRKLKGTKSKKSTAQVPVLPQIAIHQLACHPSGNLLYVTYGSMNKIQIINTDSYATEAVVNVPSTFPGEQKYLTCSPSGGYVFIASHKTDYKTLNSVFVMSCEKNEIIKMLAAGMVRNGISTSLDEKFLYTAGKNINVYDLMTFALIKSIAFQTELAGMVTVGG